MPAVGMQGVSPPVHPLDQMSWNDRVWTPHQATMMQNMGMSMNGAMVMANTVKPGRGVITETLNNGQARWPGDTDGVTTRNHLVVPYRFHETNFLAFEGAREYITAAMDEVSRDYMNGCIEWVDDTDAQGKPRSLNDIKIK